MARILIIDDDAAMCAMLSQALRDAGHEPTEACDGGSGLEAVRQSVFDVVVVDLIMPGKEGIETIIEMKRLTARPRIIAISGSTGQARGRAYTQIAAKLGATNTLVKPFTREEFMRVVQAELEAAD